MFIEDVDAVNSAGVKNAAEKINFRFTKYRIPRSKKICPIVLNEISKFVRTPMLPIKNLPRPPTVIKNKDMSATKETNRLSTIAQLNEKNMK